jgi:hypothetical protein
VHLVPFNERSIWWQEQMEGANQIYHSIDIDVQVASISPINFRDGDGVIDVGFCAAALTEEHQALFDAIPIWPQGVVVYIIDAFENGGWSGCAAHPPGRPGLVLPMGDRNSPPWILAHELGHLLDLGDRTDSTLLMFGSIGWTRRPPELLPAEQLAALRGPILV